MFDRTMNPEELKKEQEEQHKLFRKAVMTDERIAILEGIDTILKELITMKDNIAMNQKNIVRLYEALHDKGIIKARFRKPDGGDIDDPSYYADHPYTDKDEGDDKGK